MSTLDDIIKVDENGNLIYNNWVEWDHSFIPNKPEWLREILRNLMTLLRHCLVCTSLDGCYLLDDKKPELPLHKKCDCTRIIVSYNDVKNKAKSECAIEKFTEYIFKDIKGSKGKNQIFNSLGYTIEDSEYLRDEFCRQALIQYLNGNYVLKNLDRRGQRLSIPIELRGTSFYSGWMLYPEGKIKNTTPFGGWLK